MSRLTNSASPRNHSHPIPALATKREIEHLRAHLKGQPQLIYGRHGLFTLQKAPATRRMAFEYVHFSPISPGPHWQLAVFKDWFGQCVVRDQPAGGALARGIRCPKLIDIRHDFNPFIGQVSSCLRLDLYPDSRVRLPVSPLISGSEDHASSSGALPCRI